MPAVAFPEASVRVTPRSTLASVAEAGVAPDTASTPPTTESASRTRNRTGRRLFEDIFPSQENQPSLRGAGAAHAASALLTANVNRHRTGSWGQAFSLRKAFRRGEPVPSPARRSSISGG